MFREIIIGKMFKMIKIKIKFLWKNIKLSKNNFQINLCKIKIKPINRLITIIMITVLIN